MANHQKTVNVSAGPNTHQLLTSLSRTTSLGEMLTAMKGTSDLTQIISATSVTFSIWMPGEKTPKEIRVFIDKMERKNGVGDRWELSGDIILDNSLNEFEGYYDSHRRNGQFTVS